VTDALFASLARDAARRYPAHDRFARHFAHGKLRGDPVFRFVLEHGLIPRGALLLDLGCGQGVLAALIATADESHAIRGIELRARDVERARSAVPEAQFDRGDIRTAAFGRADVVALFDVLHYIDLDAQRDVLARAREALAGGGVLLVRIADADGSLRMRYTLAVDRLAMALRGQWFGRFHCKAVDAWKRELEALGFSVESHPMAGGTGFANALLVARYDPHASS
jgi:trans-aconitate methyltransferase